jgi:hypothetical protein
VERRANSRLLLGPAKNLVNVGSAVQLKLLRLVASAQPCRQKYTRYFGDGASHSISRGSTARTSICRSVARAARPGRRAEEVSPAQLGIGSEKCLEPAPARVRLQSISHGASPFPGQVLVEAVGDPVGFAVPPGSLHEPSFALHTAVAPKQDPRDTNVLEVADSCSAEGSCLPAVRQFVVS